MDHTEIESKLVICAEQRREVVREIHDLKSLAEFSLVERRPRLIHDRYFDTETGDLARHDLGLRLRVIDDDMRVTFKGPPELLEGGGIARLEIEETWSPEAIRTVLEKLRNWGIEVPDGIDPGHQNMPEIALESIGLRNIQQRQVRRIVRDAFPVASQGAASVAEIVIDAVTFRVGERDVLHDEIEIEGIGSSGADHVRTLTRLMQHSFEGGLRIWNHSKLATGVALEALAERGELEGCLDPEGRLLDHGYDRLAGHLVA